MSFILDALKKSESERQRQDTPGIASIPESGQQRKPARWPWLVVGLLAINLAVLAGIMLNPGVGDSSPTPATTTPEPSSTAATANNVSRPVPATAAPAAASLPSRVGEDPMSNPPAPQVSATTAPVTDGLPTLRELRAAGQMQLPEMHLDIHVYSGQPNDRFVFVNMSKYKEGATLTEGPRISEITPEGVVLDYFGTRFLLPRE